MKRLWVTVGILIITAGALAGFAMLLLRLPGRNPQPWRASLDNYIYHVEGYTDIQEAIVEIVKAPHPEAFKDVDFATYARGSYFSTNVEPQPTASPDRSIMVESDASKATQTPAAPTPVYVGVAGPTPTPMAGAASTPTPLRTGFDPSMGRPLFYPPLKLWCVRLRVAEGTRVVFVAKHEDAFIAEWIVHQGEVSPFSPQFGTLLEQVGCTMDFTLDH